MKLLIFDTETTGLPKVKLPAYRAPNNWPHIVSISWIILNTDTNKIEKLKSFIVKCDGWVIPEESIAIHGITNEVSMNSGVPLMEVMSELLSEKYDGVAAHNLHFDENVIINAIVWDLNLTQVTALRGQKFCTMQLSKDICRLTNQYNGYKTPKLKELYQFAFGKLPDESQLHGSLYDTKILTEIIQGFEPLRRKMGLHVTNVSNIDGLPTNLNRTLQISFT